MNKVELIGNLAKEPELSETANGTIYCILNIAVNRQYKDKQGEKVTDFFTIMTWRGQAENCGRYLSKGDKIAVVGELQNRTYEAKDGTKRQVTEIVASEVEFILTKTSKGQERPQLEEVSEEDLPF